MRCERADNPEEATVLQATAVFFIVAIIAAIFGFGGIAVGANEIAKILFFIYFLSSSLSA
jgi:uncharacterized membrane protein YtjA (UPF0391 family)